MLNRAATKVIASLTPLIDHYDGFLVDQWGVLHNGSDVFPGVIEALKALRQADKTVAIISNSGRRAQHNRQQMTRLGIDSDLYQAMITSGETAWLGFNTRNDTTFADLGQRCLFFSRDNDCSAIEGLALQRVERAQDADFAWLSGIDSEPDRIAQVRVQLAAALQCGLPLVCSNPDTKTVERTGLGPGPGALAHDYQQLGGEVRYIGKPWPTIYRAALAAIDLPTDRIVAIGDSLQHDIGGAAAMGIDGALITSGVHQAHFATAETSDEQLAKTGCTHRSSNLRAALAAQTVQ